MFTFGIFSTHFPYIAFVVFYAYFLIFGVDKASKGEIRIGRVQVCTEVRAVQSYVDQHDNANFYYKNNIDLFAHTDFDAFIFKRKLKHYCFVPVINHQTEYYKTLFNRPPPFQT